MKLVSYISLSAVALATVFLAGCSKDQIPFPEENDPVFVLSGTMGGEAITLTAGDNNAYMFTSVMSVNGVRVFSGELSDGETSIELGIFDGNLDQPNHVPEVDLSTIALDFAQSSSEPFVVLTRENLNQYQNIALVDWYVNGVFEGANNLYITEPGKYDICAFVTFETNETAELCDEIIIGYERSANCSIDYDINLNGASPQLQAELDATGAGISSVEWFMDGIAIPSATYDLAMNIDSSFHLLTAKVVFDNGVVREKSCVINGSNPSLSIDDFSIFESTSTANITNQDYKVRLEIERDGRTYKSILADNESSSITLLGLEEYTETDNGSTVYKVTLEINAIVMEVATEKLIPINFTTTLGVEVP